MRNLLNPKWLLAINTLPVVLLILIVYSDFSIIKTLLSEENLSLWKGFGLTLIILTLLHLGYTITCIVRKQNISMYYAYISLVVYIAYIYIYSLYTQDILPWSIPRWMLSGDILLYVGTFLMPTLAHSLFIIVIKLTSKDKDYKAWQNILAAVSIPIICYLFFQIILPLWNFTTSGFGSHVMVVLSIVAVILFLFFLIRGIYILATKKGKAWKKYQLLWKIPIAILFPLLGLAVNSGFLIDHFSGTHTGIFGDFSHYWFYVLALVNGILICLPSGSNTTQRLFLFIARSITFAYTLYFFIVFLPYLPLSVFAIIAIGVGFLMLTPLVLFVIHIQELTSDYNFLKAHFSKALLITFALLGFLVIPACITASYTKDRVVLHEALDYLYSPNYSERYAIDKQSLQNTLNVVRHNKDRNDDFFSSSQKPYLSKFFNWIVLDNLTLSDGKINTIERVFFNTESFGIMPENIRNTDVSITNVSSSSTYNTVDNTWTSWIDLEITNANTERLFSEYATTIDLPNGAWINNYYLYVGDRKEMGILAEKKSAMWVFSQIRGENRDPGLLHYLTGNKVSFRVFPFSESEVRKTGIEFIHKEPMVIDIDSHKVQLGDSLTQKSVTSVEQNDVAYISSKTKEGLTTVKRQPYYHFIVDISAEKQNLIDNYISTLDLFLKNDALKTPHKISFANTYTNTIDLDDDWKTALKNQQFEGGFYLERAIKTVFYNTQQQISNTYPIIIAITDTMNSSIISKDFKDFKFAFPENNLFYHLNTMSYLASHDLTKNPKQWIDDDTTVRLNDSVLAWPNANKTLAYLPNNTKPDVVLKTSNFQLDEAEIEPNKWTSGLVMEGQFRSNVLHPEHAERDWHSLVKYSFMSQIMTPHTSYIVVENEAQKAILKKKQEAVLSGKKSLDLNEDTQRMSEPEFYVLLILVGLFLVLKQKKFRWF
ncbi:MSEP-CTERM sorting domain-containing protein [uncultured Psychroserpens sp.]|uniref:MSEP-CTERM sorting domain-containing protein n=1 Tax=uncultured Psychroserpens sp. TaxID=255436 RepID=UPI00261A9889|nr:MSEP-CTERM sorting domain-containing protein [uncultured Psychroserpens sp.]